jgi:hypothetical protein
VKLSNLANVLRAAGLTVVETPGWSTRGYAGQDLVEVRGVLWHHTATPAARRLLAGAPTLQMTINGRSDLAGPLCNITFGRDGTVYLVAAGVANHAGRGSAPGIPTNAGNHYLIGIEMESSGLAPWDWTADQIRVAPHLGAALERAYLQGLAPELRLQLGHKEYSSEGKIDPAGWPGDMDGLRAAINATLSGSGALAPQGTTTTTTTPPAPGKDQDDMLVISQAKGDAAIWIGNGISRRQIPDVKTLQDYQKLAAWGALNIFEGGQVMDYPPAVLGADVNAEQIEARQAESIAKRAAALVKGEQ